MRLLFRQHWQLLGIERMLRRSEPHMAAMLAIFARLNAGEPIMSCEHTSRPGDWAGPVLAVLAGAMAVLSAAARRVTGRAARLYAGACRPLIRAARLPSDTSSAASNTASPRHSLGL